MKISVRESYLLALESAWRWREDRGLLRDLQAVRLFHGPGESSATGSGQSSAHSSGHGTGGELAHWAVDRFGDHAWVTQWEGGSRDAGPALAAIQEFLVSKGIKSVVFLGRPERDVPQPPRVVYGQPPEGRFVVREFEAQYLIQFQDARHPGLFLDHRPLRAWLESRARGWDVLNTFAYTGSLSVAAGRGGARAVTTLDLSKPTLAWAEANWKLNALPTENARFIFGDYFEWLPRLKREGRKYDCVILDPPSFSRGKKGSFSTSKDLIPLHELALDVLKDGGTLVTSINSANVAWSKFESEVLSAYRSRGRVPQVLARIDLPETFPTRLGDASGRYLKGWILQG